ncbi:FIG01073555: hypothetical protein [Olavius algarvensis associated proteobacterium Delta 3]|nr:FIG01073555: hypothetical protein [Olavius algarvensis associated proteobacterium Delta 3]CAB5130328.1 FIG01073555: hypothetical protein [Olavius algarvensis associated proteobacterium Delta 3]
MDAIRVLTLLLASALFITGFQLDNAIIPRSEILSGGPPKDGIPAILDPRIVDLGDAGFMYPDDPVIGVVINGQARAYPVKILNWHEVVNDTIEGVPIAVTF